MTFLGAIAYCEIGTLIPKSGGEFEFPQRLLFLSKKF
jgi:amino acid transporter